MNIKLKKIIIFLIVFIFIFNITNIVCAYDEGTEESTTVIKSRADDWISTGEANPTLDTSATKSGFEEIAGLLWGLGIFIAVAVGIIVGIKFMLSAPQEKAEFKESLAPYIVGVVLIVGALTIWKIAISILDV